jgi:pimeloyl-ACP methyl ester carboxylesterase
MRVLLPGYRDLDRSLQDLSEPGALTAALNWYRANLPVERLLGPAPELPRVQAAALGVWSSGDLYLTEQAMVRSADRVDGHWRYEPVEGASHWIPLDQPDTLNSLLLDFLAG